MILTRRGGKTAEGKRSAREAYLPFSAGPRVCPGAGFAMMEGVLMLARILKNHAVVLSDHPPPVPVAHLDGSRREWYLAQGCPALTCTIRPPVHLCTQ